MKYVKNDKGLTLVEVIAGVVLISIILLSFFSFFTNAANFNAINNSNITSSNIVRETIATFNDTYNGKKWSEMKGDFTTTDYVIYKKLEYKDDYILEISINSENDPHIISNRELRQVKVAVWRERIEGNPLSESYTYHEGG